jgi:uncharacterized protein YbjT (DUF2867 family)
MKTAIVAGATGLVGNQLIQELINDNRYSKIIVIARRELRISHPKLELKLTSLDLLNELTFDGPIDECFCALGTTQKKSGKRGILKVDFEYVVQLANLCTRLSIPKFLMVSSNGANANSSFFYMQTKGKMEEAVKSIGVKTVYIVRPSLITGKREEFRFAEVFGFYLYKLFTPLMVGKLRVLRPVSGLQIAKSMIALAQKDDEGNFTVESDFIQLF